jgi:hypothetical protein
MRAARGMDCFTRLSYYTCALRLKDRKRNPPMPPFIIIVRLTKPSSDSHSRETPRTLPHSNLSPAHADISISLLYPFALHERPRKTVIPSNNTKQANHNTTTTTTDHHRQLNPPPFSFSTSKRQPTAWRCAMRCHPHLHTHSSPSRPTNATSSCPSLTARVRASRTPTTTARWRWSAKDRLCGPSVVRSGGPANTRSICCSMRRGGGSRSTKRQTKRMPATK